MTKDHRQDALKPCPFCDGGETRFDEKTYWTGQRSETLSWELRHWCNGSGLDSAMITVRGKTKEEVINRWNTRAYEAGKADANTLPELPEGWLYDELRVCSDGEWRCHIYRVVPHGDAWGDGHTPHAAAQEAIKQIEKGA